MHNGDILRRKEQDTEEHWISISDMMAGLMVIFLFIAISYMLHVSGDNQILIELIAQIEQIVDTHKNLKRDLFNDLERKFSPHLKEWNAVLNRKTLSIRFREPEVLFAQGKAIVRPPFKEILNKFFPEYIEILTETKTKDGEYKYRNDIAEIRIEGHTSSEWYRDDRPHKAYIHNMKLSQDRTRSVLEYVLDIKHPQIQRNKLWITKHLTANGLSSSKLIFNPDGTQNRQESRRVEFRVRTNAEKRIAALVEKLEEHMKKSGEQE